MKTILCYGDSNTWGYIPNIGTRFDEHHRWTGVMSGELGEQFRVVEAGLCGRTTIWDDPFNEGVNGKTMLLPEMRQASPLNLVILALGTNDLRWYNAWDAAMGCDTLVQIILTHSELFEYRKPKVLLISPTYLDEQYTEFMANPGSPCSREESMKFAHYYRTVADFRKIAFFDAASVAEPLPYGEGDGAHMGPDGHHQLGKALAEQVRQLLDGE